MTDQEISNALRQRLNTVSGAATIVWENAPGVWDNGQWKTPEPPFIVVSMVVTPPRRVGLVATAAKNGRLVASVMSKAGEFTSTAEGIAETIVAAFPLDLRLTAGSGQIEIVDPAYAEDGRNDGTYWRVDTHIRWRSI